MQRELDLWTADFRAKNISQNPDLLVELMDNRNQRKVPNNGRELCLQVLSLRCCCWIEAAESGVPPGAFIVASDGRGGRNPKMGIRSTIAL